MELNCKFRTFIGEFLLDDVYRAMQQLGFYGLKPAMLKRVVADQAFRDNLIRFAMSGAELPSLDEYSAIAQMGYQQVVTHGLAKYVWQGVELPVLPVRYSEQTLLAAATDQQRNWHLVYVPALSMLEQETIMDTQYSYRLVDDELLLDSIVANTEYGQDVPEAGYYLISLSLHVRNMSWQEQETLIQTLGFLRAPAAVVSAVDSTFCITSEEGILGDQKGKGAHWSEVEMNDGHLILRSHYRIWDEEIVGGATPWLGAFVIKPWE